MVTWLDNHILEDRKSICRDVRPSKARYYWAFFLVLHATFSLSAEAPDYSSFVGVYEGNVDNGGINSAIVTTLIVTEDGRLRGDYVVIDETGTLQGTLSNPRLSDPNTVSFEWTDRHGEGFEVLEFTDDFKSFTGFWGDRVSDSQHPLTGTRK